MKPSATGARRVLTRKRAVIRDSATVVRLTVRGIWQQRFLLRTIGGIVVIFFSTLVVWRAIGHIGSGRKQSAVRPYIVGFRLMAALCIQHIVASWLFDGWTGATRQRVRSLWRRLLRRLPAFALCSSILGWLDHVASTSSVAALIRGGASFGFRYALSYAIPAAAVYRCGMVAAFRKSFVALRTTFGADLFAWSGVWLVNGAAALITALPEAFDLFTPGEPGGSQLGRWLAWLIIVPTTLFTQAVGAGFCTVIFYALARNQSPTGYPTAAVETVSGLQLER